MAMVNRSEIENVKVADLNKAGVNILMLNDSRALARNFIKYLAEISADKIVFAASFNGSSDKRVQFGDNVEAPGYDMSFIHKHAALSKTCRPVSSWYVKMSYNTMSEKTTGKNFIKYDCDQLRTVYFVDFRVLLCNQLSPVEKPNIRGSALQDFANIYSLRGKDDIDHTEAKRMILRGDDMTHYI
jgi:hypothetical protein